MFVRQKASYFAALDRFPWSVKGAVTKWGSHNLFG
jgi:hypothetical protein